MPSHGELRLSEELDSDKGFQSKRRLLVITSILLAALVLSGASIMEANTFILKVEFQNHEALNHLLAASCFFLVLRYYAYAQKYHERIFDMWSAEMLNDSRVFYFHQAESEADGLLSNAIEYSFHDKPGITRLSYKVASPFRRKILIPAQGFNEAYGEYYYKINIPLHRFKNRWKPWHLINLFRYEALYQLKAILQRREHLDIYYPYILGWVALGIYIFKEAAHFYS